MKTILSILVLLLIACGRFSEDTSLYSEEQNPLTSDQKWSSLHNAVNQDNIVKVTEILKMNPSLNVVAKDKALYKITPLQLASQLGYIQITDTLIEAGAEINFKDSKGATALHYAVSGNHLEITEILLNKGADTNIESFYTQTPLIIAKEKNYTEIETLLLNFLKTSQSL